MVVDTSVWIDYFNNYQSWQVRRLTEAIMGNETIVLPDIILTEILWVYQVILRHKNSRTVECF